MPPPPSPRLASALLAILILGSAGASAVWSQRQMDRQAQQLERLTLQLEDVGQTLKLLRLEQGTAGQGVAAVLEKLRQFAPEIQKAGPRFELDYLQTQLGEALGSAAALGPDSLPEMRTALEQTEPGEDDELRHWILRAMIAMDKKGGAEVLEQVLTGRIENVELSARNRWFAADLLLEHDKPRAGVALRRVLRTESVQGVNRQRLAPGEDILMARGASNRFHNFIPRYVQSEDPEIDATLRMILTRKEHDRITIQTCVEKLGERVCVDAAPQIQDLFFSPPGAEPPQIFQSACVDALARILGQELCGFLREQALKGHHEMVLIRIRHHLKELGCP